MNVALGAQAHDAYFLPTAEPDRLKVLVYDESGLWLCTRRLQVDSFAWPLELNSGLMTLRHEQFDWLVAGLPWQRLAFQE